MVAADPDRELTVDLEAQVVHLPGDEDLPFDVDPFARMMLLAGTDELGYLLGKAARDRCLGRCPSGPRRYPRGRSRRLRPPLRAGWSEPRGSSRRLRAMKTPSRLHGPLILAGLAAVLTLGACAAAAAPSTSPAPSASPPASPSPVLPGGGGSSGDPGTGIGAPVDPAPVDPGMGQPTLVVAKPGQLDPRPLPASKLEATVDGRRVLVKATWTSGVEPCNVLDSVVVDRSGTDISITIVEGPRDPNAMCIEIAMFKATIVDLGELEPGAYTISSPGGRPNRSPSP